MLAVKITGLQGFLDALRRNEAGQGLVEYSLIMAFIAVVAIAALTFLGSDVSSALSSIANAI